MSPNTNLHSVQKAFTEYIFPISYRYTRHIAKLLRNLLPNLLSMSETLTYIYIYIHPLRRNANTNAPMQTTPSAPPDRTAIFTMQIRIIIPLHAHPPPIIAITPIESRTLTLPDASFELIFIIAVSFGSSWPGREEGFGLVETEGRDEGFLHLIVGV